MAIDHKLTPSSFGRKAGPWDPATPLERKAIRHAAWLHRAAGFDAGRRLTITISSEFAEELALTLRELVHGGRSAA